MSIERPYELVALPLPLDRNNGQTFTSAVHGLSSSGRPRKRPKLAVAIDGEGLNIYDVHPVKLDSSYSLPPQSKFTCAPCCIHQKLKGQGTQKSTYASIRDPLPKIIRFSETSRQDSESVDENSSSFDRRELESEGMVVQILPWVVKDIINVLVVYSNGLLQCLSGDLSAETWRASLRSGVALQAFKSGNVEFVELHSKEALTGGVFRNRPDMLVPLEGKTEVFVLSAVISSSTADKIALYTIQTGGIFTNVSCLSSQYLELPTGVSKRQGSAQINLNLKKGSVIRLVGNHLIYYDISEPEPVQRYNAIVGESACSLLQLSEFAVLLSTNDEFSLLNTAYGSIYTTQSASLDGIKLSKKRKREESPTQTLELLDYFPTENLVVAKVDGSLIGIQVSLVDSSRRKLTGGLIDAIARGTIISEPLLTSKNAVADRKQEKTDKLLDKLQRAVSNNDSGKFEQRLASFLDVKREGDDASGKDKSKTNGKVANGKHKPSEVKLLPWLQSAEPTHIPPSLRSYLESVLFSFENGKFGINLEAPNALKYMIQTGNIEIWQIYSSHRIYEPTGELCIAISDRYPTLTDLLLNGPLPLPVGEILGLVRHFDSNKDSQSLAKAVNTLHRSYQTSTITHAMRKSFSSDDLNSLFIAVSNILLSFPHDDSNYLSATLSILTSLLDASAFAFTLPIQPVHSVLTPLITDLNSCVSLKGALESVLEYSKHASAPRLKGRKLLGNGNGVVSTFSPGEESGSALPLDALSRSSKERHSTDAVQRMVGKYSIERIEV